MNVLASDRRSSPAFFPGRPAPRLYDCLVEAPRSRHYSSCTEEAYLYPIHRFLVVLFLYRQVLEQPLDRIEGVVQTPAASSTVTKSGMEAITTK